MVHLEHYCAKSTRTLAETVVLAFVMHEAMKVVAVVIGTVAAPPLIPCSSKEGPVTWHERTSSAAQNMFARAPRRTRAGSAQMRTCGFAVSIEQMS